MIKSLKTLCVFLKYTALPELAISRNSKYPRK